MMNIRMLQLAQMAWVRHNFPKQLGIVTAMDVAEASEMTLDGVPEVFQKIANAINEGRLGKKKYHGLLGMAEELGELMHAFLKAEQGIREHADGEDWKEAAGDACADLLIFMCSFCNTHGIDLADAVEKAWAEVSQRDWQRWPRTGRPSPEEAGSVPMVQCRDCKAFVTVGHDECTFCGANIIKAANS